MESVPVSLYVPCYNVEQHIGRCLEGVLRQTYPIDEILVVDDGCRDGTAEIASRYPVRIIRHAANLGLAAGRNTAFREARNDLVASLDADCVPEPRWLETLVPHLLADPAAAAAGGQLIETVLASVADRWRNAHMHQDWGPEYRVNPPFVYGNNNLIRKTAVVKVGWYSERLRTNAEDADLSWRLLAGGYRLIYDPSAIVWHHRSDNARSILRTYWRGTCFANFQGVGIRTAVPDSLKRVTSSIGFMTDDFRGGDYSLLLLDASLPLYTAYHNGRLVLTEWRRRISSWNRPQPSS